MEPLKTSEAFAVYSSSRTLIVQIWSFYSLVTLGILGFTVGSDKELAGGPWMVALIVAGYVAFAIGNASAVVSSQAELVRIAQGIDRLMTNDPNRDCFTVRPIPPAKLVWFYLIVSTVVSIAIIVRFW